jgi:hypothetical protein
MLPVAHVALDDALEPRLPGTHARAHRTSTRSERSPWRRARHRSARRAAPPPAPSVAQRDRSGDTAGRAAAPRRHWHRRTAADERLPRALATARPARARTRACSTCSSTGSSNSTS